MFKIISEKIIKCIAKKSAVAFFALLFSLAVMNANAQQARMNSEDGPFKFHGFIGHPHESQSQVMVKDIPRAQMLRECMFYAGDSLYGFDFGAKCAQAEKEGDVMYSEFRVFMFR